MKRIPLLALLGACAISGADLPFKAKRNVSLTLEHMQRSPLVVRSRNGSVHVHGDPKLKKVQLEVTFIGAGSTQADADQRVAGAEVKPVRGKDGTLTITATFPGNARRGDGALIRVRVPDASSVDVRSSNGAVGVSKLDCPAKLHTSKGTASAKDIKGPVEISSSNGRVTASNVAGAVTARTSNGRIVAAGIDGPADLDSANGAITLDMNHPSPFKLNTANGAVMVTVGRMFRGDIKLKTSHGSVRVNDPGRRATSSVVTKSEGEVQVGEGGARSTASTSNGAVTLTLKE